MSITAASPDISATVTASAGSGKTWLLVARMVRLLLHGAEPGSILALTFTRKAAGEMQVRLTDRLRELALADDQTLTASLIELGETASPALLEKARALYEQCLFADYPVRAMTFHSFCQDILSRFPVEANLPPGFELVESTELLIQQSLELLYNSATLDPDGELAQQLEILLDHCNSIDSTRTALRSFIDKRSDWWAYTETESDAIDYAINNLRETLSIHESSDPTKTLFSRALPEKLERFRELHMQIATDKQMVHAETIALVLQQTDQHAAGFEQLKPAFLNKDLSKQKRKVTKKSEKALGADGADEYVRLHEEIAEQLLDVHDQILRLKTFARNCAWYKAGAALLENFQQLKSQLQQLDFTDLEWRTYLLLKHADNAEWVQYKLDQRIDHLLIDEFQDTNPTQWFLLKPLLEELAAGDPERQRTVFIVGDEKQSIYGFRRANPELQGHVANWLQQQIGAEKFPLNKSWRSSPAVIEAVNAIFRADDEPLLDAFPAHGTHRETLNGMIVLRERFTAPDKNDLPEPVYFRNPLEQARIEQKNTQYLAEAEWIANKITDIIDRGLLVEKDNGPEAVNYSDIYILLKNRSHVAQLEEVLRQHQIPFTSANRSTLLDSLEIQDMEALLKVLVSPHDDLALAQVLKSPVFSASDDDLLLLARMQEPKRWFKKLEKAAATLEQNHPLAWADRLLKKWRAVTDLIPVHDLLDQIYFDSNLINQYRLATPEAINNQVHANLLSFLELALDIDSGRYPSVTGFINQLQSLRHLSGDAPDEAAADSGKPRVQIMTVHAAKGLEAPVVFLADSDTQSPPRLAHHAMVDWPTDSDFPNSLHLMGNKESRDRVSQHYIDQSAAFQQREDLNLLYVALTRAKQFLFISASEPGRKSKTTGLSWYQHIVNGFELLNAKENSSERFYSFDDIQYQPATIPPATAEKIEVPEELSQILFDKETTDDDFVTPSQQDEKATRVDSEDRQQITDEDAKTRGTMIHRAIELLSQQQPLSESQVLFQISTESGGILSAEDYQHCIDEALAVIQHNDFRHLFDTDQIDKYFNELPIHYQAGKKEVHGVIDRVVICGQQLFLVDYKTHRNLTTDQLTEAAEQFKPQMQLYQQGIQKIWPDHTIKSLILFTANKVAIDLQ